MEAYHFKYRMVLELCDSGNVASSIRVVEDSIHPRIF